MLSFHVDRHILVPMDLPDDPGRISRNKAMGWNALGDHGSRGNNGTVPDSNPLQDDHPAANPHLVTNAYRSHRFTFPIDCMVIPVEDIAVPRDQHAIADGDIPPAMNLRAITDGTTLADLQNSYVAGCAHTGKLHMGPEGRAIANLNSPMFLKNPDSPSLTNECPFPETKGRGDRPPQIPE